MPPYPLGEVSQTRAWWDEAPQAAQPLTDSARAECPVENQAGTKTGQVDQPPQGEVPAGMALTKGQWTDLGEATSGQQLCHETLTPEVTEWLCQPRSWAVVDGDLFSVSGELCPGAATL